MSFIQDAHKKVGSLISENASTILTAGGVVGTVTTAVLTGRAAAEATKRIADKYMEVNSAHLEDGILVDPEGTRDLTKTEKFQIAAPLFVPPVIVGGFTIGSIVMSNRISAQKAAALAAGYGVMQGQLDEYKAKVAEKLGVKKAETISSEVLQDQVNANPPKDQQVIVIGSGEVLCYESYSGRYFKTTVDYIRKAENMVYNEIMRGNECPLQVFYDELDLPPLPVAHEVGWNINHPIKINIHTVLYNENEPCLAIEYEEYPIHEFRVGY